MKKQMKIILSVIVALPVLLSQNAFAGGFVSHHYHRNNQPARSTHVVSSPRYVRHVYAPRAYRPVYRPVYYRPYRPYVRPVFVNYYTGYPCEEDEVYYNPGVSWDVNFGSGGIGVGIHSGW